MQRMASSLEKIAGDRVALERDRDYYKRRFEEAQACSERLWRRVTALKGVITRLKKRCPPST